MNWCRFLVILVAVPVFALPATAGWFDRHPKIDPASRVPELLAVVKTERNDRKREAAAEELRQYDPKSFPALIPVLIDVAQNDASPGVRLEALSSLSKFRPVSQTVGDVLEYAVSQDKSLRVRLQMRTTLISYHLSGYHAASKPPLPVPATVPAPVVIAPKTTEPPLAEALPVPAAPLLPAAPPQAALTPAAAQGPDLTPPKW